mmetsp:Transcript_9838/g.30969  ORF Transcript_9838/g.30969 Transcript_9838/m.30969 type:complete len:200 (-) Transcript_9838:2508-3107(-)
MLSTGSASASPSAGTKGASAVVAAPSPRKAARRATASPAATSLGFHCLEPGLTLISSSVKNSSAAILATSLGRAFASAVANTLVIRASRATDTDSCMAVPVGSRRKTTSDGTAGASSVGGGGGRDGACTGRTVALAVYRPSRNPCSDCTALAVAAVVRWKRSTKNLSHASSWRADTTGSPSSSLHRDTSTTMHSLPAGM